MRLRRWHQVRSDELERLDVLGDTVLAHGHGDIGDLHERPYLALSDWDRPRHNSDRHTSSGVSSSRGCDTDTFRALTASTCVFESEAELREPGIVSGERGGTKAIELGLFIVRPRSSQYGIG